MIEAYKEHLRKKVFFNFALLLSLLVSVIVALRLGSYNLSFSEVFNALAGAGGTSGMIIWNMRLPRVLAALLVGAGLALAGAAMQTLLRNPLASPFTMGISHGAMFGASLAIFILGSGGAESTGRILLNNPYSTAIFAFLGSILGVSIVLTLARLRGLSPEAMILAGVAMSAMFTAGTTLIQYFADEIQLASMVYWSFGDLGRASWREIGVIGITLGVSLAYFVLESWDLNAIDSGDDIASSLGVNVGRVRIVGTLLASLITAVSVSFVGIIGFIGLICPHIVRLLIGGDHRFLLPSSVLLGALLLLLSDTFSRMILSPTILPVGIITSFMGAPLFVYLLVRREVSR